MRQPRHRTSTSSTRGNALWGRGGRLLLAACSLFLALGAGSALAAKPSGAFVPSTLLANAQAHPDSSFDVIVRGVPGEKSASIATYFTQGHTATLKNEFYSIDGVAGTLSGADLVKLAENNHVFSITPDASLGLTAYQSQEVWRTTDGITSLLGTWWNPAPQAPAIAIVDSGIDATKSGDFGRRVVANVNFCSTCTDGAVDDEGHGTMVAGLAAGAGLYAGVAQNAPLVNLRTADGQGASRTSDVLASIDWILQNKSKYNIRVANFSMVSSATSSFRYDPLDAAVEKLWFNGVVVVSAVGNYGTGSAQQVSHAPGNDPFVISVGAVETHGTAGASDDTAAPWSVFGHTLDGFAKPELSAPGRWMVAPVPMASTLATTAPDRVVANGYMWMSGTSLSAPIVAGAAAQVLARHPGWTPDQVKGALMKSASKLPYAPRSAGVGEVNAAAAAGLTWAPNPQTNLDKFIKTDASGNPYFDGTSWMNTVKNATDWSATDWSATDWSATDWSATDWSATDWSATDWSATDWSATDWSATDWSATDWSATDWSQ